MKTVGVCFSYLGKMCELITVNDYTQEAVPAAPSL